MEEEQSQAHHDLMCLGSVAKEIKRKEERIFFS